MICKICEKECSGYTGLSSHIVKKHKIKTKEYYDKFFKVEKEGICYCGKTTQFYGIHIGYLKHCSSKCGASDSIVRLKYNNTNQQLTGYDNPSKNPEIIEKKIKTRFERTIDQNLEMKKKYKKTWQNFSKNKLDEITLKRKLNYNQKTGYDNPLKNPEIRNKIKETNQKRYNGNAPYCSNQVQEKGKQTCLEHYGVDNYSKTFEGRQIFRENLINDMNCGLKDPNNFSPRKGHQETEIINDFELLTGFFLPIRGEKLIGYFPDSRNDEKKIIVEVYEPWHKYTWSIKHDIIRQKDLELLGYKFFIIWLKEWKENKEKVIIEFQNQIKLKEVI